MSATHSIRRITSARGSFRPKDIAIVALVLVWAGPAAILRAESLTPNKTLGSIESESRPPTSASDNPSVTLAEIEACATQNFPSAGGIIGFSVDAVDRTGVVTASRAELRWRKPDDESIQILLVVSEPAKTAGTALLIIERQEDKPEFFVRLPEMKKVRQVKSRRLRGPVLGTDFSYEDLKRLREPLDRTQLEVIGVEEIEGRPAWILETIPGKGDDSEYSRVLTYVDQETCLPIRIDLFERGGAVDLGLARAEPIEIGTMYDEDSQ